MRSMFEKYVGWEIWMQRMVCKLWWMKNMDAKDGLQVMIDEKYGWEVCSRIRLDEKYVPEWWWMRSMVPEWGWMRNMEARDASKKYDGW